ncbi:MAG: hypothetical protein HY961_15325 [Ignavibacteriae bacterium]|nr:hypothetical protein [Ignavibacteriota bacterium]
MKIFSVTQCCTVLMLFAFAGCHRESDVNSPVDTPFHSPSDSGWVTLFRLPAYGPGEAIRLSDTNVVAPGRQSILVARLGYITTAGKEFSVDARFTIPIGAVSDTVTITISLDTLQAAIRFGPEGLQFLRPAQLDITLKGLDPFPEQSLVKFLYENPLGSYDRQEFESMRVTGNEGKIIMRKGNVPHFSRYAFGRLHGDERLD